MIVDRGRAAHIADLHERIDAAVRGGVGAVHARAVEATAREAIAWARGCQSAVQGRAWLIVNDRIDVAVALGATGAQLGGRSLTLADARRAGPGLRFGCSVHTAEEARSAGSPDWLLVGTLFPTASHPGAVGSGVEIIRTTSADGSPPCIGIGGITRENVRSIVKAGAYGIAVLSAILETEDPGRSAQEFRDVLDV